MSKNAFDPYQQNLPITDVLDAVKNQLSQAGTVVLSAPPGAGKSTLLPLALYQEAWLEGKKIIVLEPRRLAAKNIARRMADLLGEKVGQTVGYRIRFEQKISDQTRIEILTEGILTRMLQNDNALENIGLVVFDEFHERSLHADLALALTRECQRILREDLRLLIMSATLDTEHLTTLLNAPLVVSEGRQYPVTVNYEQDADEYTIALQTADLALKALKQHEGDILIFLPGQREIHECAESLKKRTEAIAIHELYGQLPLNRQQAAIFPDRNGRRKIVIATSIAETSLTIEGIKIVIDSGFGRTARFDPRTGLSGLKTIRITKDAADQRAGRAGRLSPGICYRLWSKGQHAQLADHRKPEIMEADLTALVLDLAQWGIQSMNELEWVDRPPAHTVKQAYQTLTDLNALEKGKITAHGKAIYRFPTHPRIAHMLLTAEAENLMGLGADIAAILEERDPMGTQAGTDISLRVEALRRYRKNKQQGGKWGRIAKVAEQYARLLDTVVENGPVDPYEIGLLLVHAYPERIAFARPGNNAQFQLANGQYAMLGHRDDLAHESWLAVAHVNAREGLGKIFLAAPLNPEDLAPFVKTVTVTRWNTKKGGLIAAEEMRIGNITLRSTPLKDPDPELLQQAISEAIEKEGEHLLDFSATVKQWQNRVITVKKWYPDKNWPDVSTTALLATNAQWLSPYLNGVKKPEDLKKINLLSALQYSLSMEQQKELDQLAPARLIVPSGSSIALQYQSSGSTPVLPVRIQEVFGLSDTPTVNQGKQPVLMHLLSPGFKPVQITSDLKSFWENVYFEIRKELRIRYKKHAWPEDPTQHPAIKGAKRRST